VIWAARRYEETPAPPNQAHFMGAADVQTVKMSDQEQADIRLEFSRLKQEHADFDAAINAMIAMNCDPLQIQRMKKKKLSLKDRLMALEDKIIPDIIA
jgi:hypothetical protein